MTAAGLIAAFDALLFDLDGVVYVGPHAVPHAVPVIDAAVASGVRCLYVTNNAARTPAAVAAHLNELGLAATVDDVVTSPQAAVTVLADYVADRARVLVIGGEGIVAALRERGYEPVRSLDDAPEAVMQGYSPDLGWRDLAEATFAVRSGLPWIATNPDLTFPTPRGIAPGNGAMVQVVAQATGRRPNAVAGKPEPPLLHEAIARSGAKRPLMIGDRLDTDIGAARRVDIPSLLVFTGVTSAGELVGAGPRERPDYVGRDLRVLLEPYPSIECDRSTATCGGWRVRDAAGRAELSGGPAADPWDGLRALAAFAWCIADGGGRLDCAAALHELQSAEPALAGHAQHH